MKLKRIISIVMIGLMPFLPVTAFAQGTDSESRPIESTEISGRVLRLDGRTVTVETDNGVREIIIPSNVRVTKNGVESEVTEINTNDQLQVTLDADGDVLSVDVVSGGVLDVANIGLPLIALLLLLAGLLYWLWRRGQRPRIRTDSPTTR